MPAYMLDSNALSELIRNPGGSVSSEFERKAVDPANRLLASIITVCELRYGVVRKRSRILSMRVEQSLAAVEVVPFSTGADATYAVLRADLERRGQLIGPNDMLIAAHALALDAILVTDNTREFKRVKGLKIENWLRPQK
jgi:tRNA(fMet)-specific endonuclease VapC